LEAMAAPRPASRTPSLERGTPPPRPATTTAEREAARLRSLTEDGLPELSGLFNVDAILGHDAAPPESRSPEVPDAFEAERPAEPPAALDLTFSRAPAPWAPQEVASVLAAAASDRVVPPGDRQTSAPAPTFRAELALMTDELAAARAGVG